MQRHDYYYLTVTNQIISTKARGSWDDTMAKQYVASFKAAAAPLTKQPWGHLLNLEDWELGTPELEPIITDLMIWTIANGLTCFAQVYSPSQLKRYQISRMGHKIKDFVKHKVFTDEQQAFQWLTKEGLSRK